MKKGLKNKLISILAVACMLIGMVPAHAATNTISITDTHDYDYIQQTNPAGSDYLAMQSSQNNIDAGSYVEYNVYIEEAGLYDIEFKSTFIEEDRAHYTSPTAVTVNGVNINKDLIFTSKTDDITGIYKGAVNFEAGENIIRFKMISAKKASGGIPGLFYLHYINITPNTATEVEGSKLIVEADKYIHSTHTITEVSEDIVSGANNAAKCRGGSCHSTPASVNATITYVVDVDKAGTYNMVVYGSGTEDYWGGCKVEIGGEEYTDVSYSGTVTYLTKTGHVRIRKPVAVKLEKGQNVFYVKSNTCGKKNSNYGFSLDRIEFTPASLKGSLKFEGEDATGSKEIISGTDADGFSGGKWNRVRGTATTTFSTPEDEFDLYITVGADIDSTQHGDGKYLGTAAISIDGGEFIPLSGTNMKKVAGLPGPAGSCKNTAKWQYLPGLDLAEGEHTFAIKYEAVGSNGNVNNVFIFYDCFEVVPKNGEIEKANIEVASNKMACGNTMQADANLYYTTGYICNDELIESVSFTSSNTNVATIDENGLITAINPGVTEISVEYNDTYTAKTKVSVYDESGIIPVSSSYDEKSGKATIKLTRVTDTEGLATVILGAYNEENGVKTSFSNIKIAKDLNPMNGRIETITETITGDNVCAFVWDGLTSLKPLLDVIELK